MGNKLFYHFFLFPLANFKERYKFVFVVSCNMERFWKEN
jgi:hypothetical protein